MTHSTYITAVKLASKAVKLPMPEAEFKFHPTRKWRFDFAYPTRLVALEVDGGIWVAGRHSRGSGLLKEHEKMNAAAERGWLIFRCTPQTVGDLALWRQIAAAFHSYQEAA